MSEAGNWKFELEEYIRQGEPDKIEKSEDCRMLLAFSI